MDPTPSTRYLVSVVLELIGNIRHERISRVRLHHQQLKMNMIFFNITIFFLIKGVYFVTIMLTTIKTQFKIFVKNGTFLCPWLSAFVLFYLYKIKLQKLGGLTFLSRQLLFLAILCNLSSYGFSTQLLKNMQ